MAAQTCYMPDPPLRMIRCCRSSPRGLQEAQAGYGGRPVGDSDNVNTSYPIGRTTHEQEHLAEQSRTFGTFTKQVLLEAGLTKGMRVLDVGCGVGDVSFLCAELVGPKGEVIGVDRDPAVVEVAQENARRAWIGHVTFQEGDPLTLEAGAPFDAVVGRFVLMYAADPVAALKTLVRHLRPNGIVAFQEGDFTFTPMAVPPSALYKQIIDWVWWVGRQTGAEMQMGFKLYQTYVAAGLPAPRLRMDTLVGGGPDFEGYQYLAGLVSSFLPVMEQLGVATAAEVDIDTLADRLREEVVRGGGCIALQPLIGSWARKP